MIYWAVEEQFQGVSPECGLFATQIACEAYIEEHQIPQAWATSMSVAQSKLITTKKRTEK